ncbi:hypothetical protein TNCV_3271571 [Trichonephila clavipes]|nr:hypothetical protein TNCV_3271571 [Trichonephila clavipes]
MVIRSEGAVEYVMVGISRRPTQAIWRGKEIEPVQVIVMSFDPVKIVVASELKQFEFNGIEITGFIWRAPKKNTQGETNIGIDFGSVSIHFPLRWALESINGKGKKIGKDLMKRNKRVQFCSWDKTWKEIVPVVPKFKLLNLDRGQGSTSHSCSVGDDWLNNRSIPKFHFGNMLVIEIFGNTINVEEIQRILSLIEFIWGVQDKRLSMLTPKYLNDLEIWMELEPILKMGFLLKVVLPRKPRH